MVHLEGITRVDQNRILYIYTVYDCIFGDFPANITVHTPYIHVWFWPTLLIRAGDLMLTHVRHKQRVNSC